LVVDATPLINTGRLKNEAVARQFTRKSWKDLPSFLICKEDDETDECRIFVLHTQHPRFLVEFVPAGDV